MPTRPRVYYEQSALSPEQCSIKENTRKYKSLKLGDYAFKTASTLIASPFIIGGMRHIYQEPTLPSQIVEGSTSVLAGLAFLYGLFQFSNEYIRSQATHHRFARDRKKEYVSLRESLDQEVTDTLEESSVNRRLSSMEQQFSWLPEWFTRYHRQ